MYRRVHNRAAGCTSGSRLSLPIGYRRLSAGWLLAVACWALAAPAWAAPKDRAALRKISETMSGD